MGWEGERLTHRQYLVWQCWLANEMNHPSRTDYYLMQVASHALKAIAKHPAEVTVESQRLVFETTTDKAAKAQEKATVLTKEQILETQKAIAVARAGGIATVRRVDKEGRLISEEVQEVRRAKRS